MSKARLFVFRVRNAAEFGSLSKILLATFSVAITLSIVGTPFVSGQSNSPPNAVQRPAVGGRQTPDGSGSDQGYVQVVTEENMGSMFPLDDYPKPISLPDYLPLDDERFQDELGLNAVQKNQLRGIADGFRKARDDLGLELAKLNEEKWKDRILQAQLDWKETCRKQVEAVLTPGQLTNLKRIIFLRSSDIFLESPGYLQLTDKQRKTKMLLSDQFSQEGDRQSDQSLDQTIAILNSHQLQLLRPEVEKLYHAVLEQSSLNMGTADWNRALVYCSSFQRGTAARDDNGTFGLKIPIYRALSSAKERTKLKIGNAQGAQLQKISAEYQSKFDGIIQKRLSEAEFRRTDDKLTAAIRKKIESLLTPEQLKLVTDIEYRRMYMAALASPQIQEKVGLSREQTKSLRAIRRDFWQGQLRAQDKMEEGMVSQLSSQQLKQLRSLTEQLGK